MKISAITLILSLLALGASQFKSNPTLSSNDQPCRSVISHEALGIQFQVRGQYHKSITQKQLRKAKSLSDLIEHYPANWIDEYERVDIESVHGNWPVLVSGENDFLNKDQLQILQNADLESNFCIDVHYRSANSTTHEMETKVIHKVIRVVPDREAEFKDGNEALIQYIKHGCDSLNFKKMDSYFPLSTIYFTVNAKGKVENIVLHESTGDQIIDKRLMQLLREMPDWNPATNEEGHAVDQAFQLHVGLPGC